MVFPPLVAFSGTKSLQTWLESLERQPFSGHFAVHSRGAGAREDPLEVEHEGARRGGSRRFYFERFREHQCEAKAQREVLEELKKRKAVQYELGA